MPGVATVLEGQRDWDTARTEARALGAGFFLSRLLTPGAGGWTIVAVLLGSHIPSLLRRRKEDSQHSIAPAASLSAWVTYPFFFVRSVCVCSGVHAHESHH